MQRYRTPALPRNRRAGERRIDVPRRARVTQQGHVPRKANWSDELVKHVFLVGCQRSGTSWLQLLLAQHPAVATTQETHLFSGYLWPLHERWERFRSRRSRLGGRLVLSDDEFDDLTADFAKKVLQKIADTNPSATVVLEKTPDHVRYAEFILRLLPDAYFIHLIRDPRSVASSLCAAGRSWGARWAPRSVVGSAQRWCEDVSLGLRIAQLTDRYTEVRYEELRGERGASVLDALLAWLELPAGDGFSTRALEACQIEHLRDGGQGVRGFESLKRHPGFFRKGTADGWKDDLSPNEVRTVEYLARDLMQALGYQRAVQAPKASKPFRVTVHSVVETLERRVRSGMDAAFEKIRSVA
jgi:hypothetical protein